MTPTEVIGQKTFSAVRPQKKRFDVPLEGLRGVAALIVVLSHGFIDPRESIFGLSSNFSPPRWLELAMVGHVSVLIFFILSGFVIGISHDDIFRKGDASKFYGKRLLRILPIYLFALLFSISTAPGKDSWSVIVGHLVFAQGAGVGTLYTNPALWSLSCEAAYYLVFPLVWSLKPNLNFLCLGTALCSIATHFASVVPDWIPAYLAGWTFWLAGLIISKLPTGPSQRLPLPSMYGVLAATAILMPGSVLINGLHLYSRFNGTLSMPDLLLVPVAMIVFVPLAQRNLPFMKSMIASTVFILVGELLLLQKLHVLFATTARKEAVILLALALVLLPLRFNREILSKISVLGAVSYAVYVIHMPLLVIFRIYVPLSLGSPTISFSLKLILFLLVLFVMSWILERVVQPKIRDLFRSKGSGSAQIPQTN